MDREPNRSDYLEYMSRTVAIAKRTKIADLVMFAAECAGKVAAWPKEAFKHGVYDQLFITYIKDSNGVPIDWRPKTDGEVLIDLELRWRDSGTTLELEPYLIQYGGDRNPQSKEFIARAEEVARQLH